MTTTNLSWVQVHEHAHHLETPFGTIRIGVWRNPGVNENDWVVRLPGRDERLFISAPTPLEEVKDRAVQLLADDLLAYHRFLTACKCCTPSMSERERISDARWKRALRDSSAG